MKVEYRTIDHFFKIKLKIKQMVQTIGPEHGVIKQRQTGQSKTDPGGDPPAAVEKGELKPRRPDEADPHIRDAVEHIFHFPAPGKYQKQLRQTPDDDQYLADCQGSGDRVFVRLQPEPSQSAAAESYGCKIRQMQ